jgi:chromosome segregation ATPase
MDPAPLEQRRFAREDGDPAPAEGPEADLLTRLERHAQETGRLEGRVEALEKALRTERAARRRITETLKSERVAAEAVYRRAQSAEAGLDSAQAEIAELREALTASEQHVQMVWAQVKHFEQGAWEARPLWRRLLRMPPRG